MDGWKQEVRNGGEGGQYSVSQKTGGSVPGDQLSFFLVLQKCLINSRAFPV